VATGKGVGVGTTDVGGIAVVGTAVGGTAVGGIEVDVTMMGVGGTSVLVGSTTTAWVEVGAAGCWVVTVGGLPLAGNLHDVMTRAISINKTHVRMIFLFIVLSLGEKEHSLDATEL